MEKRPVVLIPLLAAALVFPHLEDDLARCVDYDINPDYEAMLALYNTAKLKRAESRA